MERDAAFEFVPGVRDDEAMVLLDRECEVELGKEEAGGSTVWGARTFHVPCSE